MFAREGADSLRLDRHPRTLDVVSLRRRLDEVDRRLGLYPSAESERHAAKWWRTYLVAAIVLSLVCVALYIAGQTTRANLIMGMPGICGLVALQGWGVRRREKNRRAP